MPTKDPKQLEALEQLKARMAANKCVFNSIIEIRKIHATSNNTHILKLAEDLQKLSESQMTEIEAEADKILPDYKQLLH